METKIPKIIHYCWFGGNPLSNEAKKCIESWKKICPDYEIREWNEKNFDINSVTYVREAYNNKKWAFVADYVRLYAIVNYGGIYMDTDVETIKKFDDMLINDAFAGFEDENNISTGILACKKDFPIFKEFLNYYKNRKFVLKNGALDMTTNVKIITDICLRYGFIPNNSMQNINNLIIYPKEYFCPKDYKTGFINLTDNTYTIHYFSGSWLPPKEQKYLRLQEKLAKRYNSNVAEKIILIYSLPYRINKRIRMYGIINTIKFVMNKIVKR